MLAIIYFTLFFLLFLNQTSLYLFGGDSSEFSLTGSLWGIAHAPGYPFYSLLSNILVRIIPFFTIPWRISIISSFSTIATAYLIYKILRFHKISTFISVFSATFYIFLYPVWLYSLVPEVFTLHTLFVALTTWFIFQFSKSKDIRYLYLIFLLVGLQISHHHIFVLFIPGWSYLLYKSNILSYFKNINRKKITLLLCSFLIGFSFYLYAPLVSTLGGTLDWENAKTLEGFFRLISRARYGSFKAYSGAGGDITNQFFDIASFFIFVFQDFRFLGLIFIILGLIYLKKNNNSLFNFVLISILTHTFFYFYTNFYLSRAFTIAMYERFLIPVFYLLIIPFAYGAFSIQNTIILFAKKYLQNKRLIHFVFVISYIFFVLLVILLSYQNYRVIKNIKELRIFNTYAEDLLNTAPKKSIIQIGYDNSYFPSAYIYFKEHLRPDLKFIFLILLSKPYYQQELKKRYPDIYIPKQPLSKPGVMLDFLDKNNTNGIFFESPTATDSWRPYGLLWKYYKNDSEKQKDEQNLLDQNNRLWNTIYIIPFLDKEMKSILHAKNVQDEYIEAYMNYSKLLVETKHIDKAEKVVKKIVTNYRKTDLVTKTILINILVEQNKCKEASLYVNTVPYEKMSQSTNILQSYSTYFSKCDPKNPQKKAIDRQLFEINSNSEKIKQQI